MLNELKCIFPSSIKPMWLHAERTPMKVTSSGEMPSSNIILKPSRDVSPCPCYEHPHMIVFHRTLFSEAAPLKTASASSMHQTFHIHINKYTSKMCMSQLSRLNCQGMELLPTFQGCYIGATTQAAGKSEFIGLHTFMLHLTELLNSLLS